MIKQRIFPNPLPLLFGLTVSLCLSNLAAAQDFGGGGKGAAMLTEPMTCYFDSATLFGSYSTERNRYREFRFQLREDGMLIVNGHEVKPQLVDLNGGSSRVAVDIGSIVVDPKEAAMLQLLPADQKRQFQGMASQRGMLMAGGVPRAIQIFFSDNSVIINSLNQDGEEVDVVSDRCS